MRLTRAPKRRIVLEQVNGAIGRLRQPREYRLADAHASNAILVILVPTLCVGTRLGTLCVLSHSRRGAAGPCVPTQSVGTRRVPLRGKKSILRELTIILTIAGRPRTSRRGPSQRRFNPTGAVGVLLRRSRPARRRERFLAAGGWFGVGPMIPPWRPGGPNAQSPCAAGAIPVAARLP